MASCKPKNDCNCRLSTSTLKSNYGCFLNPAFEDIEIADLHFPNEDSKTHLTKLDTISESGLSYASIPHEISYDNDMYPLDAMSDEVRSFNVTVTPPKRIEKNNKIKVCKYSLWFCIWCVIVVSLAGIVATVACIVWLETYRDRKTNRSAIV